MATLNLPIQGCIRRDRPAILYWFDAVTKHITLTHPGQDALAVRLAQPPDIPALLEIEEKSFETDRLTRRNFNYLLTKGKTACPIALVGGAVAGYALVLFNAGTSLARLYSFAVAPAFRGRGIGQRLIAAAEQAALEHDCVYLRLEVRRDNAPAIKLYKQLGFREFGVYPDYYEDHMEAIRLEKRLLAESESGRFHVPFYEQTTDFTCGPSALMMAMKGLRPAMEIDRRLELRIWRESTTIFMTSGHGGCGPYGLALSAYRRGYDVEVHLKDERALFIDGVRAPEKKAVIQLVHEDFTQEIAKTDIRVHFGSLSADDLAARTREGALPIVLISSYRIYREKFPHWVVVTGADEKFIYVHDSFVDYERHKTITDCINMPIPKKDFERMARYGKAQVKATLILRTRQII